MRHHDPRRPPHPVSRAGVTSTSDAGRVLPFRPRDPAVRRRFRRHPLVRWGRPFLVALLIVAAPCAGVWWLLTSPRLAVVTMDVTSGPRVDEQWVRAALDAYRGHNLLRVPLETVAATVEEHPWAAAAEVSKELPGTLRVQVQEKEPAAVLRTEGELFLVDAGGQEIEPLGPGAPDLAVVSGREGRSPRREEVAGAVALLAGLEERGWGGLAPVRVSEVEVLGEGDFRVWLEELEFPLLLRGESPEPHREQLVELLPEVRRRFDVAGLDLRFQDRIIVKTGSEVALRVEEEKG